MYLTPMSCSNALPYSDKIIVSRSPALPVCFNFSYSTLARWSDPINSTRTGLSSGRPAILRIPSILKKIKASHFSFSITARIVTNLRMFVTEIIHRAFQMLEQNIIRFDKYGTNLARKVFIFSDKLQGQYRRTIENLSGYRLNVGTWSSEAVDI